MVKNQWMIISSFTILLLIIVLGVFITRSNNSDNKYIKDKSLSELLEYTYDNRELDYFDFAESLIIDSIQRDSNIVISVTDIISSTEEEIKPVFVIEDDYKENSNPFNILLNKHDLILADGELIEIDLILSDRVDKYLSDKAFSNKNFKNTAFVIKMQILTEDIRYRASLRKVFDLVSLVIESYNKIRDEICIEKFNKSFKELSTNKQMSFSKVYPIKIYIYNLK
jgi:hypothetical protein